LYVFQVFKYLPSLNLNSFNGAANRYFRSKCSNYTQAQANAIGQTRIGLNIVSKKIFYYMYLTLKKFIEVLEMRIRKS